MDSINSKIKALIVFYSRTNITKTASEALSKELKCDMEGISTQKKERVQSDISWQARMQ